MVVPITGNALAETLKVQIPAGSSTPFSKIHFMPNEVSVRAGDKVQWGNADSVTHTVTSGSLETGPTGLFDSGHLKPGDQFVWLFNENNVGEIKYFCTIHPWMIGIVNVVDLESDFKIYHNVGAEVSDSPVDIPYKVQRSLVSVEVDPTRNMVLFNFAGKINNDKFIVRLPEELIKNPQAVWLDDIQIQDYEIKKPDGFTTLTLTLKETTQQVKVVGTAVIGKASMKKEVLINQIFGITDKTFYERGEEIVVSGEIHNPVQLFKISLEILSPDGAAVYREEVPLVDSTKFTETIQTLGVLREFGEYTVKITGPSAKSSFLKFEYGFGAKENISPLKQIKAGLEPEEVICKDGYVLMKSPTEDIGCFKENNTQKLEMRNWKLTTTIKSKLITQNDDQKSILLKPSQRFLLNLSDFYDWKIEIDDLDIVRQSKNFRPQQNLQGIFEAQNLGHTSLRATGDPFCLKLEPACRVASILFTLQIEVSENPSKESMQMANPASVYCQENGGNLEIRDSEGGQQGICIFPNGKECDEWEYFRGECNP